MHDIDAALLAGPLPAAEADAAASASVPVVDGATTAAEAVSRRALTDHLARGTALPS